MSRIAQRDALDALPKDRLVEISRYFDLDVPASSPKADVVEALDQYFKLASAKDKNRAQATALQKKL